MTRPLSSPHPQQPAERRLVRAWPRESLPWRLQKCRAMLNLHGYLTEAENRRIDQRINQQRRAVR